MSGFESMMLQGIHYGDQMHVLHDEPSKGLQDLAGNAFQGWCHGASFLALLVLRSLAWQRVSRADARADASLLSSAAEVAADVDDSLSEFFSEKVVPRFVG